MIRRRSVCMAGIFLARVVLSGSAVAASPTAAKSGAAQAGPGADAEPVRPAIEPRAIELLKAMSARLAAAKTLSFTAVTTYESPSRIGPPLEYMTLSEVTVRRPDRFRVITAGDGPPLEVYDDGKTLMAYAPAEHLVAVADAPPSIDGALRLLYESAATYFPWTDVVVADPWADIADGIEVAFVVGQSHVVGGTTTDIVAIVAGRTFQQIWIGAEDKLPRRMRAVYAHDPARLRHVLDLSNWKVDGEAPDAAFTSTAAAAAPRVPFARPDPPADVGKAPAAPSKPTKKN
jgi:hypothetical protein